MLGMRLDLQYRVYLFLEQSTAWKDLKGWTVDICLEAYRVLRLIEHCVISTSLVLAFLVHQPAVYNPYVAAAYQLPTPRWLSMLQVVC